MYTQKLPDDIVSSLNNVRQGWGGGVNSKVNFKVEYDLK